MSATSPPGTLGPATGGRWPRAYRPLRPASLAVQLLVLVVAEVGLYFSYSAHDARFHWATHFLVGLLLTALWQTVHLLVAARPARGQLIIILAFHLWAMWPDLAFRAGLPHYRWMDWVALGHVQAHYLPGGDSSWLALALAAVGGYVLLLTRWVQARRTEAAAGMAPGLGIGGRAVARPQLDPSHRQLAHEHLTPDGPRGSAPPAETLLLLPGLGGTSATWLAAGRLLAAAGHPVLVPDLLGFGASMRLGTRFRLQDQVDALLRLLDHHDLDHHDKPHDPGRVHVVGHNWGCVVAGAVAARDPGRISRLTLVAPAAFADPAAARDRMADGSLLARATFSSRDIGGLCATPCACRGRC